VATQVLPFFEVPNWTVRAIVVAALIGFPLALAFAWFYELTPGGMRRETDADSAPAHAPRNTRRMDRLILVVLAAALAYFALDKFVQRRESAPALAAQSPAHQAGPAAGANSVAILPFENLSADADNAYFASGMREMILTRLAGIAELKVISRVVA